MPRIHTIGRSLVVALVLIGMQAVAQESNPAAAPDGEKASKPNANDAPPRRPNAGGAARRGNTNDAANLQVPDDVQLVRDVVYATAPGKNGTMIDLKMDCAFPKQSDTDALPVVIYIHGGGWSAGNRAMGQPFILAFAQGGYFSCSVSYRLSGEAVFPAQLEDVKDAVRFIRSNAEKLAIDPNRIGVWGHSAGGHLSALLGVTGDDVSHDGPDGDQDVSSAVQAVVDVSGPTDLVLIAPDGNGGPMISGLLGGTVREKQELAKSASPITHIDAKDAPFLIIQGGADRLVPNEQAEVMRDALTKAGVECEYLFVPEADHGVMDRRAFEAMAVFFDKHLGGDAEAAFSRIGRRLLGGGAANNRPRRPNAQQQPTTQPK